MYYRCFISESIVPSSFNYSAHHWQVLILMSLTIPNLVFDTPKYVIYFSPYSSFFFTLLAHHFYKHYYQKLNTKGIIRAVAIYPYE